MREWTVHPAGEAERIDLARVEESLFGPGAALSPRWMFDDNPAGAGLVMVARTPGGDIAGTRSILPWRLVVDGVPVTVGQYARSWTQPEYRRQGVSVAIGDALNRTAANRGWPLVFIFPSDRSIPGHRRLGNLLEPILARRQLVLSARFLHARIPGVLDSPLRAVQGLAAGAVHTRSVIWEPVANGVDDADTIWSRLSGRGGVHGVRDGSFVGWRFSPDSGRIYQGWRYPRGGTARMLAFTHRDRGRAKIVDLWGDVDESEAAAAIRSLVRLLADQGAVFAEWNPPLTGFWDRVAKRCGMIRRGNTVPVGRVFTVPRDQLGKLSDLAQYQLTEGDSDYA